MTRTMFVLATLLLGMASVPNEAGAVACAAGVYRAGCAGPNGAAVVRRPPYYAHGGYYHHGGYYGHRGYYGRGSYGRTCAAGPYRAGCAGPNGAAVVRRPY